MNTQTRLQMDVIRQQLEDCNIFGLWYNPTDANWDFFPQLVASVKEVYASILMNDHYIEPSLVSMFVSLTRQLDLVDKRIVPLDWATTLIVRKILDNPTIEQINSWTAPVSSTSFRDVNERRRFF
jgi:hypothetical protein